MGRCKRRIREEQNESNTETNGKKSRKLGKGHCLGGRERRCKSGTRREDLATRQKKNNAKGSRQLYIGEHRQVNEEAKEGRKRGKVKERRRTTLGGKTNAVMRRK